MFLVDTSPSMSKVRTVDLPPGPEGEERIKEMTNLEWALQFVKLKIQEMVRSYAHVLDSGPTFQLRFLMGARLISVASSSSGLKVRG